MRSHLSAVAQRFANRGERPSNIDTTTSANPVIDRIGDEEDDYGYLDYIEISESKQAEMTDALNLVNEATVRIGQQMSQRTNDLNSGQKKDAQSVRHFLHRTADDMNSYAEIVKRQVAVISAARVEAYGALSNALAMRRDIQTDRADLESLGNILTGMMAAADSARSGMQGMRDSAEALPRMSKELNKAKRSVVQQLDALLAEIDSTKLTVVNIVEAIDKMLSDDDVSTDVQPIG